MSAMTKSEVVLDLVDDGSIEEGGDAFFAQSGHAGGTDVFVPIANFRDMGMPRQITVTIQPGDRLNTEES